MCSHFKRVECTAARIAINPCIKGFLLDTPQDTGFVSGRTVISVYKRGTHQLVPSYTLATGKYSDTTAGMGYIVHIGIQCHFVDD
jgi:hypothetical protein